ncbi:phosphatidylglycerol lysyltransferase domain-containing protein [Leifsonia sp. YIM 134122]|uniref:Phosphatidylglycerol lysyltransferase domain-containing protein n=1 Tax=Leifsonia stereocauli TaxID=3134136 RepID=A0ABU9W280_9MICO
MNESRPTDAASGDAASPIGRLPAAGRLARRYFTRVPVSIAFAVLLIATAIISGTIAGHPSKATLDAWAAGVLTTIGQAHWWSPVTALFIPWDPFQLVAGVIASLTLLGISERLMGSRRVVLAFLVTGALGVSIGVLLQWAGSLAGEWWALGTSIDLTLDPLTGITGALLTASAFAGVFWRRRIRVVSFAFILVFVLYDGDSSNVYRLNAAVLGLFLGALLTRDASTLRARRSSKAEARTLIATVVAVTAIGPIVGIVNPNGLTPFSLLSTLFDQRAPVTQSQLSDCASTAATTTDITAACKDAFIDASASGPGPFLLTFVPLALLLVAAWGLRRGRRFALWLAIAVNVVLVLMAYFSFDIVTSLQDAEAAGIAGWDLGELIVWAAAALLLPIGILVVLWRSRHLFTVRASDAAYVKFTLWTLLALAVLATVYFVLGLVGLASYQPAASVLDLGIDTLKRFLPTQFVASIDPVVVPRSDIAYVPYQSVGVVFWIVFIGGCILLMRDTETRNRATDHAKLRALLHSGGGGSLSFMATWPGNTYWFTPSGSGAVAYRVINDVAITLADPISLPEHDEETIDGFVAFCDENGWTPVFYSVHPRVMPLFEARGWQSMPVGEETILDPSRFELAGKPWQKVRQALNRGVKEGMTAVWTSWDELPFAFSAQINAISEAWVSEKSLPEMGFTLGSVEELRDRDVKLMLAVDTDERVQAVTSWMPTYRDGVPIGWTLDFMRRADGSMNGTMEFLIASAALHMKEQGATLLSLSGAPLATKPLAAGENPPAPTAMTRMLDLLARTLEPAYGFSTLFRFKSKFNPRYETISMAYPDPLALPAIGVAIGRAYVPNVSPQEAVALVRTLAG